MMNVRNAVIDPSLPRSLFTDKDLIDLKAQGFRWDADEERLSFSAEQTVNAWGVTSYEEIFKKAGAKVDEVVEVRGLVRGPENFGWMWKRLS